MPIKCVGWKDEEWQHLCNEAMGPPWAVHKGHKPAYTWSEFLLDARAGCSLLWWIVYKNGHHSSPVLVWKSLCNMTLLLPPSGGGVYFSTPWSRFGHMTGFDWWPMSKCVASRGIKSVCSPEFALLAPPWKSSRHMSKLGLASSS